jgi:hypothetical protein
MHRDCVQRAPRRFLNLEPSGFLRAPDGFPRSPDGFPVPQQRAL